MHLTESHLYAFNRITRMYLTESHVCLHLTESHVYENHTCMHLTESHVYAFNRITGVCI